MRLAVFSCFVIMLGCAAVAAQTIQVSPSDVNAYSQGPTSALLTFGGVVNKRPAEATWCGQLIPAAPELGLKCDPATLFGNLPLRYTQLTPSGNNAYTDVMSVTPQVARRAYVDAVKGNNSTFFYVRRFVSTVGGVDECVPVTIRLTGNGAGVPLSLTEVKLSWGLGKPVLFVKTGEKLPRFEAEISYTGSGRLQGRWELVKPGEDLPDSHDLLTEASLPIEERGTQKRYAEISRFNIYLPRQGKVVLPGPEVWRVDESLNGLYLVLLRIEASDDKEADTDLAGVGAGAGIVHGGAVAGFSLPVLRYCVSNGATSAPPTISSNSLVPLFPQDQAELSVSTPNNFTWSHVDRVATYHLEVQDREGHAVISAIVRGDVETYRVPPWFRNGVGGKVLRWRVSAWGEQGKLLEETAWRNLKVKNATGAASSNTNDF
jgi:hypothetical protein